MHARRARSNLRRNPISKGGRKNERRMDSAGPDWSREFDDPIELPNGHTLRTLHEAGHYVAALPKALQERFEWRSAAGTLIQAAQGERAVKFAQIAMLKALHAPEPARERRRKPAKK